jgi:hypothetical protein
LRRGLGLELRVEDVGGTSCLGLVDGALINVLFLSSVGRDGDGPTEDDGDDGELFLGVRLLELSHGDVPAGAFDLESEDVSAFLRGLLVVGVPVELLLDVCLDK